MNFSLLQFVLLALGLAAMYAQARMNRARDRADNRAHIEKALAQLREAAQTVPEPIPPSGMNLNKRTQAVRMLRRGENVGHIAAALGVPRGEVELLVRVREMSAKRVGQSIDPRPYGAPGLPFENEP